jgi:hypothetical protein
MSSSHSRPLFHLAFPLLCTALLSTAPSALAQNADSKSENGFDLSVHANGKTTAADIGLPFYPGAVPAPDNDNDSDSSAADLGFSFGDFHFKLLVVSYKTNDSPDKVLAFYRKPLAKYGEVLECDHGKAATSLTVTRSGLTCSDKDDGGGQAGAHASSDGHELRAGSPHHFRIVGIDNDSHGSGTRFGLVYLDLPRDSDKKSSDSTN